MLVAMTYNTFLFTSIIIGAFVGHILYEGEIDVGSVWRYLRIPQTVNKADVQSRLGRRGQ